ncbi:endoribonuclease Dcr-1 [Ceratina calcarata]|uniref:ribonuclease III n=1 Tax=Ceratina calcarata TaxID=156304 RepID=A0AAJ7JGA1_9HYME|nr:endoribonuclease Dcr-1 [Ceratina calcarata]
MAHPLNDQIYTKSFTPREYQVELFYAARNRDIIVCLGKNSEQTFLVIKVIQEFATNNRRALSKGGKRSVYILKNQEKCITKETYIRQLTDLRPLLCEGSCSENEFAERLETSHVLLTTSKACAQLLREEKLCPRQINLVIVDECHKFIIDDDLNYIIRSVVRVEGSEKARVIGLAVPLFSLTHEPGRLESELDKVEATLECQVETASDILSILRYSPKPREYVIEHSGSPAASDLQLSINLEIVRAVEFLTDHRHDPTEIYTNEEFLEDIQRIPDPKEKPFEMLRDLLEILESLGPWCADRAALSLLYLTEKLKVKTPYERHYLLLNMISSVLVKIRAICDSYFSELNERERIYKFTSPKVHRILEILKCYQKQKVVKSSEDQRKTANDNKDKRVDEGAQRNESTNEVASETVKKQTRSEEFQSRREKRSQRQRLTDPDLLCGVIFVDKPFVAKVLFYLLNEVSNQDEKLSFLSPLYTIERTEGDPIYSKDVELEHRKQEEVLKRFRIHECNLLISTAVLEEGIDIPKCNFVMRYDFPKTYQSYVQCKSRARAVDAVHVLLVPKESSEEIVRQLAQYRYTEKTLLAKCSNNEPTEEEENEADSYADLIPCYKPLEAEDAAKVTFNSAISLVNRYCAKLPSDTFTRLTPEWSIDNQTIGDSTLYTCSLRLPINSPLKYIVTSYPMPNRAMARRMAALQLCVDLHKRNEIDDNLLPIGKENFKAKPEDVEVPALPDESRVDLAEARPGTTKRRQYYYKKTAEALTDCRPRVGVPTYLYHINMVLSCPLPEEQNTRGRRIYPPEESAIGFGIITLKEIPKLCPFPIYTRSGEVRVKLKLSKRPVLIDETRIEKIAVFLNYTFTNVLRLQQYLMLFDDPNTSENSYMIVPVKLDTGEDGGGGGDDDDVTVDWDFLECIYENRNTVPTKVPESVRRNFQFDPGKYHDAVIMPWYRSQDQPQYFYVAEICTNLNPKSTFPGEDYATFEEYYSKKYGIQIQNLDQPLLDVDHTSARLNFLTPRYVNRKGVALPTSSEETKRAKRENLEQKQILVAELCSIHPFPASLWRQAVCLPCILYRINALLLADQIRCQVARAINLGQEDLEAGFEWPPLDFGWSLKEVLKRAKESERSKGAAAKLNEANCKSLTIPGSRMQRTNDESGTRNSIASKNLSSVDWLASENPGTILSLPEPLRIDEFSLKIDDFSCNNNNSERVGFRSLKSTESVKIDEIREDDDDDGGEEFDKHRTNREEYNSDLEIGTWSSELITELPSDFDSGAAFPVNFTTLPSGIDFSYVRSVSPNFDSDLSTSSNEDYYFYSSSDSSYENDESENEDDIVGKNRFKIAYTSDNVAEAVEDEKREMSRKKAIMDMLDSELKPEDMLWPLDDDDGSSYEEYRKNHLECSKLEEACILRSGAFVPFDVAVNIKRRQPLNDPAVFNESKSIDNKDDTNNLNGIDSNDDVKNDSKDDSKDDSKMRLRRRRHVSYVRSVVERFESDSRKVPGDEERRREVGDKSSENPRCYQGENLFSFDHQPELENHPGPSPSLILQALTMSNANDGINLERLETIGDSFLKYAITTYLYCTYENIHEGKLSHLRSKQVSNLNLYRLGRRKCLGESMIATKFEPHDNWLPPCYYVPKELEQALIESGVVPSSTWAGHDFQIVQRNDDGADDELTKNDEEREATASNPSKEAAGIASKALTEIVRRTELRLESMRSEADAAADPAAVTCFIPYNLITQHSIPDKSIADCVEALIGAYLIACGPRGALLFMAWLGIHVLPTEEVTLVQEREPEDRIPGSTPYARGVDSNGQTTWTQMRYGRLGEPQNPLLHHTAEPEEELSRMLDGYEDLEKNIGYKFRDMSYLLQAFTHASYQPNRLTDCYQRLEFLGDAVLDYLITRHLYEDSRQHSPGALTDLRSALVNNTIFASLAVRCGFHKYFRHLSPGLCVVINRFVRIQEENGHSISEEYYLIGDEECEEAEDVEVPKALGDVFESLAGAIYLDSGMSLDAVWSVYYAIMKNEIEQFSTNVPKSPIRELLELEPETAKFGKPEKLADGRRVRVTVDVFGKGSFKGIGRNYRIAKCTAAKCALKKLKRSQNSYHKEKL